MKRKYHKNLEVLRNKINKYKKISSDDIKIYDIDKPSFSTYKSIPFNSQEESYSEIELKDIMIKFMNDDQWTYHDNNDDLFKLIKKNKDILKFQAGDLRTIFQLSKENYSLRLLKESLEDGAGNKEILIKDLEEGFNKFRKHKFGN